MYKILKAEQLTANIFLMDVEAPRVARHCEPGQFVIVKMDEKGERIPLTICDYDREAGTITIVFQPVGASTTKMKAVSYTHLFCRNNSIILRNYTDYHSSHIISWKAYSGICIFTKNGNIKERFKNDGFIRGSNFVSGIHHSRIFRWKNID